MKLTARLLYLEIIMATLVSCQSQPATDYASELQGCLNPSDIQVLNTLSKKFEAHIINSYQLSLNECYKKYLQDVATGNFPQGFFSYPTFKEDLNSFRGSEFYNRTWVKTSSFNEELNIESPLTVMDGEVQQPEVYDPIVIDPTGDYVHCLTKSNVNKTINDYLEVVKTGIDISPGLVAQTLHENLTDKEYDDILIRLIIAINFHYQIGLLITEED